MNNSQEKQILAREIQWLALVEIGSLSGDDYWKALYRIKSLAVSLADCVTKEEK